MTECSLPCVGHIEGKGKTWFHLCANHVEKAYPFNLPQEATAEISSDLDTQAEILYAKLLSKKGMPLASLRKISTPLGDIMTYKDIIVKFGGQTLHWVATRQVSKYEDTWAPLE
jgi:hypothetical protein